MIRHDDVHATQPDDGASDLLTRKDTSACLAGRGIRLKPAMLTRLWSTGGDGPPCRHVRAKSRCPRRLLRRWALSRITEVGTAAPAAARARRRV